MGKKLLLTLCGYTTIILLMVGLHLLATFTDRFAGRRVIDAVSDQTLTANPYPGTGTLPYTAPALLGIDIWPDCQSYLAILAPKRHVLAEAIAQPMYATPDMQRQDGGMNNPCQALVDIIEGRAKPVQGTMKLRYWAGARAFTSLLLSVLPLFQATMLLKSLACLLYLCLGLLLLRHSPRLLAVFSPVPVLGLLFGGIDYFGGIALALPHIYVLVFFCIYLLLLPRFDGQPLIMDAFFLAGGAGSAYIFLLDGHLQFLLPVILPLIWFSLPGRYSAKNRWLFTCRWILLFTGGFAGAIVIDQLLTMLLLDPGMVWRRFADRLRYRLAGEPAGSTPWPGSPAALLAPIVLLYRYQGCHGSALLQHLLFASAGIAATSGMLLAMIRCLRRKSAASLLRILPFVAGIILFFLRYPILWNHSAIHPHLLARYLFVPQALCWSILLVTLSCRDRGR